MYNFPDGISAVCHIYKSFFRFCSGWCVMMLSLKATKDSPMKKIAAFINGVCEFRLTLTAHYDDDGLLECYGRGREFAHRLTFRYFEPM